MEIEFNGVGHETVLVNANTISDIEFGILEVDIQAGAAVMAVARAYAP